MTEIFKTFADRFNKKEKAKPVSVTDIKKLESEFQILLPEDYKTFLLQAGYVFTPGILSLIVDKNLELNDVQEFWEMEQISKDKNKGWTSKLEVDLIPFAIDCLGNLFAFKTNDIKEQKQTAAVYLYDHEFDTVEKVADNFTEWIDGFNKI